MNIDILQNYIPSIHDDISLCNQLINDLVSRSHYIAFDDEVGAYYDEEYELYAEQLESTLNQVFTKISLIYEAVELMETREEFRRGFSEFNKKLRAFDILPYIGEPSNEALRYLSGHLQVLEPFFSHDFQNNKKELIGRLERILQNTPNIIYERKIIPEKEADVRNAVLSILKHIFPTAKKEATVPKILKKFAPDIGITELKTAIEYKYCNNESDVKTAVGGIFEDMHGYAGSPDYTQFYAVIYMTDAFITPSQLEAELEHSLSLDNWHVILVTGKGTRKRK